MANPLRAGLLLLGLLALGVMTDQSRAGDAGIEGVISVSPNRPGPLRKEGSESAKAVVAHTAFVVHNGEKKVASFVTDDAGRFQLSLPPGHYVISREDPGAAVGQWRFEVDVTAGATAKVNWTGDSGMR